MFKLEGVTRKFGSNTAVKSVTLDIPDGQMVGIIGRSGAGKSTLLRMINRLIDPNGGRIVFHDTEVSALRGKAGRQAVTAKKTQKKQAAAATHVQSLARARSGRIKVQEQRAERSRKAERAALRHGVLYG